MPNRSGELSEFNQELSAAARALSDFQTGLAEAIEAANEAAQSLAPEGGGGGAGQARRASGEAKKDGEGRGIAAVAGKFAKRTAAGIAAAGVASVFSSIRGGTSISAGIGASVASAAAFVVPGLGQKVDAASLAADRTSAITAPLARFGVEISPRDREAQFEFEFALAEKEVKEKAEVKTLSQEKQTEDLNEAVGIDRLAEILVQILEATNEGNRRKGGAR